MTFKDKDELKKSLTIEQVYDFVADLGGEPQMANGFFIAQTICHNLPGEGSKKLYYYDNTKLFKCFTECNDVFDIFELVCKVKKIAKETKATYDKEGNLFFREWELYDAITFVSQYFNYQYFEDFSFDRPNLPDWNFLNKFEATELKNDNNFSSVLPVFNEDILKNFPCPHIKPWESEGITYEVLKRNKIAYNPKNHSILIPHYSIDGDLVGLRERTLIKEEEKYGKYKPVIINKKMFNHPLGLNLYNLNHSKNNIKLLKTAIVFEGEKSPLMYASYFPDSDISVACCGSSFTKPQFNLLMSLGVNEIIIAFDKQFKSAGDKEWRQWTQKLTNIANRYGKYVKISFIFDKEEALGYKESPIDRGPEVFLTLLNNRFSL